MRDKSKWPLYDQKVQAAKAKRAAAAEAEKTESQREQDAEAPAAPDLISDKDEDVIF